MTAQLPVKDRHNATPENADQYLTFSLDGEEYGVDILKVQEIKGYAPPTRIPNAPREIAGVLNLRGTIVPLLDLRRKFGLQEIAYDAFTAVVVLNMQGRVMGMIVDRVSEVVRIPAASVQPPPDFLEGEARLLHGMAKVGETLVTLLNVEAVLMAERGAVQSTV